MPIGDRMSALDRKTLDLNESLIVDTILPRFVASDNEAAEKCPFNGGC